MSQLQRTVILFFVTGAGAGYFPRVPGTMGTIVAIPLSFALNRMAVHSVPLSLLTLGAFFFMAAWLCQKGEKIFRQKDCPKIVLDEMAGFLLANFLGPPRLVPTIAAFFLFRFFDIIKVYPARQVERIPGGAGVVLDDFVAGLYSFLLLHFLLFWSLL